MINFQNMYEPEIAPALCVDKFGLQATEQHSETTYPRRNIFAQTNYDDIDFFTKSNDLFEEKSGERDAFALSKAKSSSINDFLNGDKN